MMAFESVLYVCGGRGKGGVDNGVLRNKAEVVPLLQEQPRQQNKGLSVIVVFAVWGAWLRALALGIGVCAHARLLAHVLAIAKAASRRPAQPMHAPVCVCDKGLCRS